MDERRVLELRGIMKRFLSVLGQQWSSGNDVGLALFEETRATAGAGAHTATQNTGSHPARGAAIGIVALHAPSGQLLRRGTAIRNNPASGVGAVIVDRPTGTAPGDLIVALGGFDDGSTDFAISPPDSSWTLLGLRRSSTGGGQTLAVYSKVAGWNEPASYTFTATYAGGIGGPIPTVNAHATIATSYAAVSEVTAPTAPGTPTLDIATAGKAALSWSASTDANGIAYYRVHRSTTSGFTPAPANEIAQTTANGYTDSGDGSTYGLPAGTWYYKFVAVDLAGNVSTASGQGSGTVSADAMLPRTVFVAPTPAALSTVGGTMGLAVDATPPATTTSVGYGFDAAGFRRSRTVGGQTTRYLLGGLIETDGTGTITSFDLDGPAGDLAHYAAAPSSTVNPSYSYYSGHGDLAGEANQAGTRTRLLRLDPWGQPIAPPGSGLQELFTGRWDKKHDTTTNLIELGARPYDAALGRFLAVDPVDGGSFNEYDYSFQDPVNTYDLDGQAPPYRVCSCILPGWFFRVGGPSGNKNVNVVRSKAPIERQDQIFTQLAREGGATIKQKPGGVRVATFPSGQKLISRPTSSAKSGNRPTIEYQTVAGNVKAQNSLRPATARR